MVLVINPFLEYHSDLSLSFHVKVTAEKPQFVAASTYDSLPRWPQHSSEVPALYFSSGKSIEIGLFTLLLAAINSLVDPD